MCLMTPLPRGWAIYKDEAGEPFYYETATGDTSYQHPVDGFFMQRVRQDRERNRQARAHMPQKKNMPRAVP